LRRDTRPEQREFKLQFFHSLGLQNKTIFRHKQNQIF